MNPTPAQDDPLVKEVMQLIVGTRCEKQLANQIAAMIRLERQAAFEEGRRAGLGIEDESFEDVVPEGDGSEGWTTWEPAFTDPNDIETGGEG